ncbi:putative cytochrome P450 E-class, group I [Cladorrhinum sp. PSN332]|nr:putative cytochrome P450 E-class, group I [Cladorrhinum sp. PSN332]
MHLPSLSLETLNLYLLCPALSIIYSIYSILSSYRRLSHIPGPLQAHFTSLYITSTAFHGNLDTTCDTLHAKYGPLVRIGPNSLLLSDFSELSRIQGVRSSYYRSDWNNAIRFDSELCQDSVTTIMNAQEHAARKAKLKQGYEGKSAGGWDKVVDEQIEELIGLLRRYIKEKGGIVDWARVERFFVVDVTTAAVTGRPWGGLKSDSDVYGLFEAGDRLAGWIFAIGSWGVVRRVVYTWWFVKRMGPFNPRNEKGLGRWWGIVKELVKERASKPDEKRGDMLTDWLAQGMTPHQCELDAVLAVVASSDGTSTAIRSILLHLVSATYAYNKLKSEIAEAIKKGTVSDPATNSEARQLLYLQAVLYEGIRIVPGIVTGFPKCVPPKGDTICEIRVPGGTEIFQNHRAVMLDRRVFGHDVHTFRPERWIECSSEQKILMTRHVDSLFGFGRWQCLGRTLAWVEINKLFVELLRNFNFQIANPSKPWRLKAYTTTSIDGFLVRVSDGVL